MMTTPRSPRSPWSSSSGSLPGGRPGGGAFVAASLAVAALDLVDDVGVEHHGLLRRHRPATRANRVPRGVVPSDELRTPLFRTVGASVQIHRTPIGLFS